MRLLSIMVLVLFISACNTEFDLDITSDNHPLLAGEPSDNTYSQTAHPIVLVHGLYGFEDIFGLDYFYQVPEILRQGGAEVFIARVSGTTTPAIRGEQLITQLEDWMSVDPSITKFNLMGHSLGAPTIRYVAAVKPEMVASVTSISGVNFGSEAANAPIADVPLISNIIGFMGNVLGHVIDMVSQANFEQNLKATIDSMATEGATKFNDTYPVGLPTWAGFNGAGGYCNGAENAAGFSHGSSNPNYNEAGWQTGNDFSAYYANDAVTGGPAGPYDIGGHDIRFYSFSGNHDATNGSDPLDGLHKAVSKIIEGDDDDGFVERCSTHLGYVIKDNFVMNHLDVMNWFLGLRDSRSPYPPMIYRAHAHQLKTLGL